MSLHHPRLPNASSEALALGARAVAAQERRRFLVQAGLLAASSLAPRGASAAAPPPQPEFPKEKAPPPVPASQRFRIDVHHHIAPPEYVAEMRSSLFKPSLSWTPQKSLDDMDEAGVETAIVSITTPGVWVGNDQQGRRLARECNDYGAKLAADYPGRFGLFAAIPLPDTDGSLAEIEYGLDQLKADGIALFSSYRDRWLGDPHFDPVMEELNRRGAVVYVHPDTPLCCRNVLRDLFNNSVIEYATDTTRAIASLLFRGTIRRFRRIRWIFAHGGGTVPFLVERLERVPLTYPELAPSVPDGVMAELVRFHYDLAQCSHPAALAALTKIFPISQLLWGTDFPFRRGFEYVRAQQAYGFSEQDLRAIGRGNALTLLPRWRARRT